MNIVVYIYTHSKFAEKRLPHEVVRYLITAIYLMCGFIMIMMLLFVLLYLTDTMSPGECVLLATVLRDLIPLLPYPVHGDDFDSDSESEEDLMIIDEQVRWILLVLIVIID